MLFEKVHFSASQLKKIEKVAGLNKPSSMNRRPLDFLEMLHSKFKNEFKMLLLICSTSSKQLH